MASPEKSAADERLGAAIADLNLSERELRAIDWLMRFDAETVDTFVRIIRKARSVHRRVPPQPWRDE